MTKDSAITEPRRPALAGDVRQLAERLLTANSVRATVATLRTAGVDVTYNQVDSVRRAMGLNGKSIAPRERAKGAGGGFLHPDTPPADDPAQRLRLSADALASEMLHEATIAMFTRRGAEMGCDFAMAGAMILNAPERLAA